MSISEPLIHLLPIAASELYVVQDALVAYAAKCEAEGDHGFEARIADTVAERMRGHTELAGRPAHEMMKAHGIGRYKRRPQG